MNAIELNHIHKSFGGFAIQDLSLTVPSGTICGLVGRTARESPPPSAWLWALCGPTAAPPPDRKSVV